MRAWRPSASVRSGGDCGVRWRAIGEAFQPPSRRVPFRRGTMKIRRFAALTALPMILALSAPLPAFAITVTDPAVPGSLDGANGADSVSGPGGNGTPGGNASATASAPADDTDTANAFGGKGGNGGNGGGRFSGGTGGPRGKARPPATPNPGLT